MRTELRWQVAFLLVGLGAAGSAAWGDDVRWVVLGARGVDATRGFVDQTTSNGGWRATVRNPVDPSVAFHDLNIDADGTKYLYLKMTSTRRDTLRIFFSPDQKGPFYSLWSFKTGPLATSDSEVIYRMDLPAIPHWRGTIRSLRIKFMGHYRGDHVTLSAVGISTEPLGRVDDQPAVVLPLNAAIESHDRMAGWQDSLVSTNDTLPNSALYTYIQNNNRWAAQYVLAKLVPGVEIDGQVIWATAAERAEVVDVPGGVRATFMLRDVRVFTEITPLMVGRDSSQWEGAAYYTIRTDPPTPMRVKCGGGREAFKHGPAAEWVLSDSVAFDGARTDIERDTAFLTSAMHPLVVGVRGAGTVSKQTHAGGAESVMFEFEQGTGSLSLAFSKDKQRTIELVDRAEDADRRAVDEYYDSLLSSAAIETPEPEMDGAFRAAVLCMEYCWYAPYGWIEGIHHWVSMFHMQHTAAAQWIGQADRARDCILSHAERAYPNGAIPHLLPNGNVARHFGGHNQFYFWEVAEYWKHTGDLETLRTLAPVLDGALDLTYAESDTDRDLLLGWGLQIGNQEDFIATPYNGSVPTIEGINMLCTRATVAQALGDEATARVMTARAQETAARLRGELWMHDLGRFAYYKDPAGNRRLDGQYETCTYPLIYNIVDSLDGWTSIRHLRERLTGVDGEVYLSNNFPDHLLEIFATWGMQAGAAQQPWAAWGLNAAGLHNETWRPLKAISAWVMDELKRGSWPEVAYDGRLGYFSPPAALFVQATIEALFGLRVDLPAGTLTIAPSFPDHWPAARLTLPEFSAEYRRAGDTVTYAVRSKTPLARRLRWMLPPGQIVELRANGRKLDFRVSPGVGCVILEADTGAETETVFELQTKPLDYTLDHPASVAEGDPIEVRVRGARIERIDDRCGVLLEQALSGGKLLNGRIRADLLTPYEGYGRLGQMNFARRTFFVLCQPDAGSRFWAPVDMTILPRYEASARGVESGSATGEVAIRLLVRNNTDSPLTGSACLRTLGKPAFFGLDVPPRSESESAVTLPAGSLDVLSPGDNRAALILPTGDTLDLVLNGSALIAAQSECLERVRARTIQVDLPADALTAWQGRDKLRDFYSHLTAPLPDPLSGFPEGAHQLEIPELPGVNFKIDRRRLVPVSAKAGREMFTLPLGKRACKKVYLLLVSFIENHDMFAELGRVELVTADPRRHPQEGDGIITRTLRMPGDLDWWLPSWAQVRTCTCVGPRPDRHGLLPLLGATDADWELARPPLFPEPELWADSLTVMTPQAVMNVIEIDLGEAVLLKELRLRALGPGPAFGLVAVSVETAP